MGTPIPLPGELGGTCGAGEIFLWPAGKTPKYIKADFIDVENCGEAEMPFVNGTYVLEQNGDIFCEWLFETDNLLISVDVDPEVTLVEVVDKMGYVFFASWADTGTLNFGNLITECGGGNDATGGSCDLDFT